MWTESCSSCKSCQKTNWPSRYRCLGFGVGGDQFVALQPKAAHGLERRAAQRVLRSMCHHLHGNHASLDRNVVYLDAIAQRFAGDVLGRAALVEHGGQLVKAPA